MYNICDIRYCDKAFSFSFNICFFIHIIVRWFTLLSLYTALYYCTIFIPKYYYHFAIITFISIIMEEVKRRKNNCQKTVVFWQLTFSIRE